MWGWIIARHARHAIAGVDLDYGGVRGRLVSEPFLGDFGYLAVVLHAFDGELQLIAELPLVLSDRDRRALIDEILRKQQEDGGWTLESLGPWTTHPDAPSSAGSSSYATGFVAYVLEQAALPASQPGLARALEWLKAHQDGASGSWPAVSMNKRYPPGSMQERFLQDAATGFAAAALAAAGPAIP